MIGGQLFGLPISRVQDVFMPERLTRVPLAPPRGRGHPQSARPHRDRDRYARAPRPAAARRTTGRRWRSASSMQGESYGLLIDSVGEVMKLPDDSREANPVNLDPRHGASRRRHASARGQSAGGARRRPRSRIGRRTSWRRDERLTRADVQISRFGKQSRRADEDLSGRRRFKRHPKGRAPNP